VEEARALGVFARADVLAKLGDVGPSLLRESFLARPLLAVAGRPEGGLLTKEDLTALRPESAAPEPRGQGAWRSFALPWERHEGLPGRMREIIAVGDVRGVLAVLSYDPDDDGIPILELELRAPRDAEVVRRGVPRTAPGHPLPVPGAIAVLSDVAGGSSIALGFRGTRSAGDQDLAVVCDNLEKGLDVLPALAAGRAAMSASGGFAVLVVRGEAKYRLSAFSA
jgi:hypothetical protein